MSEANEPTTNEAEPSQSSQSEQSEQSEQSGQSGQSGQSNQSAQSGQSAPQEFETLTSTYERLRHSTDTAELSEFARRPLPDKSDQAAFSRATALLEAVAGNPHTPVDDRIFLAETMPFPNVLVKLSVDADERVRKAVAANGDDKNWLVGRLTKDPVPEVRDTALRNKRTSWKMRLEGAQNPDVDAEILDFLSRFGVESEPDAPAILTSMVRRAVALNPNTGAETLARLAQDPDPVVVKAVRSRS
ncbi:AbrB family transcriptional regulator [Bifidobacterium ramosum]|uniref:AbrB family transcriptional regulator n=1 Tax=Bifidobacterium ramosum TaxID=1798158 RepID=A0A6L4X3I5_9BIFI|nr:AbrB family transcriptional regulator [Bifidobacterium ramosum]KAB8288555.1 AbrB family transcriptional regulator [Bifidobacterium ramosum]NEG71759.1 AbrB family transcriptional regulator [Bifidobacterium ramosum]